ncbi:hypothetical protein KL86DPRO_70044 [uncultured delta proteobacterium]|uniref:Uncharacterized protein n=1 Tax=uncultured delta proteobacterium TaxID=34034 RepID=A0A212KGP5_9DELT|nr:hypothetical protein KL86DPRO_70044 [uncultured delta proteobacterium]
MHGRQAANEPLMRDGEQGASGNRTAGKDGPSPVPPGGSNVMYFVQGPAFTASQAAQGETGLPGRLRQQRASLYYTRRRVAYFFIRCQYIVSRVYLSGSRDLQGHPLK